MEEKNSSTNQNEVTCPSCAGNLTYTPGTKTLKCEYCGASINIEDSPVEIKEFDFDEYLKNNMGSINTQTIQTVKCNSCGAHISFDEHVVSDRCPFCSSVMVIKDTISNTQIKPGSILPFSIDNKVAFDRFKTWIKKLWFAPNDLTKKISNSNELRGLYIPYWTYDTNTNIQYSGQRGDNYYVNETYTTVENGKTVTRTRTVTKIRWSFVSGNLDKFFDDILIVASKSLPTNYANALEPWDLTKAVPYNEMYLSGYRTETYQIDIKEGFDSAKKIMDKKIEELIKQDIGGDHQQISSKNTDYSNITFKHTLLPIYISTFKYKNKVYRFLINGQTGEVQGERPFSVAKIVGACLIAIAIAVGIYLWTSNNNNASYSPEYQTEIGY